MKREVEHPYAWLWEPLMAEETFVLKSMFGAKVVFLDGVQRLAFAAGEAPWDCLMVCTSREHHEALRRDFPALAPHPILPKWLYLPASDDAYEAEGKRIVAACRRRDPRIGITPTKKRDRQGKSGKPRTDKVGVSVAGELERVVNLGPKSAAWLSAAGITRFSEVKQLGALGCCRALVRAKQPVNAMFAYALEGAIQGIRWDEVPREVRQELRSALAEIVLREQRPLKAYGTTNRRSARP